jgi:hypothetical protein
VETTHRLHLDDDTHHVSLQGRQYELFGVDLGEGIVRDHLVLGGIIFGAWFAVMWLVGTPILSTGGVLAYAAPPWLLTTAALHLDHGGRPGYALWWCRLRFLGRRHRPVVPPLGQTPLHRALTRVEPLLRPTRRRGADQAFTVRGKVLVLHDIPTFDPERSA